MTCAVRRGAGTRDHRPCIRPHGAIHYWSRRHYGSGAKRQTTIIRVWLASWLVDDGYISALRSQRIRESPPFRPLWIITFDAPLLPYGPDRVKPSFVIFDIRALWRQSAWMSKITNDGLTRSGTWCFIAVPIMAAVDYSKFRFRCIHSRYTPKLNLN